MGDAERVKIEREGPFQATEQETLAFEQQVAENIKTWKRRFGYTSEYVAQQTGFSVDRVRKWEQGVNFPRPEALVALAKLYGVPVNTFFVGVPGLE